MAPMCVGELGQEGSNEQVIFTWTLCIEFCCRARIMWIRYLFIHLFIVVLSNKTCNINEVALSRPLLLLLLLLL